MTLERVTCTIPNCKAGINGRPWESPEGITTYPARESAIRNHLDMDHYLDFRGTKDKNDEDDEETKPPKAKGTNRIKIEAKIERPRVKAKMTDTEWLIFKSKWGRFLEGADLEEDCVEARHHLWACLEEETEIGLIHKGWDKEKDLGKIMDAIKNSVCEKMNKHAARKEFAQMNQYNEESAEDFEGRLQGKAETCSFWVEGSCNCQDSQIVRLSYKEEQVLNQFE